MPLVSLWVMPSGLLALIAIPFGFDGPFWKLMGEGIDWMIAVALWVAQLPGAVGRMAAFGVGPLLLGTGGLVVLCLLKSPLRWCGTAVILLASLWAVLAPLPDVLVAADGQAVAVRGADGKLAIHRSGGDAFTVRDWLAADGDARLPGDPALGTGFRCDEAGCNAKLPDGRLVARVLTPEGFAEDCVRTTVVVTAREAPPHCQSLVVDRRMSRTLGAVALTREGERWTLTAARPQGQDRPWARAAVSEPPRLPVRPQTRDATPPRDALEPGD
jgi:competence protein ComEC